MPMVTNLEKPLKRVAMVVLAFRIVIILFASLVARFEVTRAGGAWGAGTSKVLRSLFQITTSEYKPWVELRKILGRRRPLAACIWIVRLADRGNGTWGRIASGLNLSRRSGTAFLLVRVYTGKEL